MIDAAAVDGLAVEPPAECADLVGTFLKLMADPTRRRIFLELMQGETCNCEMGSLLGLPQNLISHHLRQLRQAGLIRARRDDTDRRWIYYAVDQAVLARVYHEFGLIFSPDRCGERAPQCGPTTQGCV
jgi:DNA-binding transcriptional ArsR family regulator